MYLWSERGKHEAHAHAVASAEGKPDDWPMSVWEWFHVGLEAAKAEERFNAETRVFQTNPLAWLKNGYARHNWREANVVMQVVQDAVEQRIRELRDDAFSLGKPASAATEDTEGGTTQARL